MGARGRKTAAELAAPPLQLLSPSLPVELPAPPSHLSEATQNWWRDVVRDYDLEAHHLRLLEAAADAWDRMTTARTTLLAEGLTIDGPNGKKTHPCVNIERDARAAFTRTLRELDLDCAQPPAAPYMRPPAIRSNRRR